MTLEIHGSIPAIVRNDSDLYEGDLKHYFRVVFNHARNLCNPYHNFRHMCHVLWLCYEACLFYRDEGHDPISPRKTRDLLIAALFHDFDHTGRSGPDLINIELALAGLRRHIAPEDREELPTIEALIRATQYPYVVPSSHLNLPAQIIRDADLSQSLSVAWIQQVVFGLAIEWGKTPIEILRLQKPFHHGLKFHTAWASATFPQKMIDEKIAEADELLELLAS